MYYIMENFKGVKMKKLIIGLLFSFSLLFAFEDLTTENFDAKVNNKNVILDFYATW